MSGNGTPRKKIADERGGDPDHDLVLERTLADPDHRLEHDREHGGLQAEEERLDDPDLPEGGVDEGERHDREHARQHEERAGDQPPWSCAGASRRRRRAAAPRAGQEHAVVERVQEPRLADPALLLDQDAVHDRDLPGGAAEGERGDPAQVRTASAKGMPCSRGCRCSSATAPLPDLARADHRRLLRKWEWRSSNTAPPRARRSSSSPVAAQMPAISVLIPSASGGELAVLEVDVVHDLGDRAERGSPRPTLEQHLEGAAVALVGELGLEHVEPELAGLGDVALGGHELEARLRVDEAPDEPADAMRSTWTPVRVTQVRPLSSPRPGPAAG